VKEQQSRNMGNPALFSLLWQSLKGRNGDYEVRQCPIEVNERRGLTMRDDMLSSEKPTLSWDRPLLSPGLRRVGDPVDVLVLADILFELFSSLRGRNYQLLQIK
jgi:hypothetical protein